LWVLLLFANGTALMMLNATVAVPVFYVNLPAEPMWEPVVKLDGVHVPALVEGRRVSVVTGGGGVVTIEYVPRLVDVGGVPAVNITTQDLLLIWANGSLLVMPTIKILNFTRLNHSLVIVARGPGYVAYAAPLANAARPAATQTTTTAAQSQTNTATQSASTSAVPTSYTITTRQEAPQPSATTTTAVQTTSTAADGPARHLCAGGFRCVVARGRSGGGRGCGVFRQAPASGTGGGGRQDSGVREA
jgi:uncharacterized membrane protein